MKYILKKGDVPIDDLGGGIRRQIMGHDTHLMLVKVLFDTGAVAPQHEHPHQQVSYCISGKFEFVLDGKKHLIEAGDAFIVPSFAMHGATCLKEGVLIDTFSPRREDFLQ